MSSPKEVKSWVILNREYRELSDGQVYYRKIDSRTGNAGDWKKAAPMDDDSPPSISKSSVDEPNKLFLVLQRQLEGEPKHWSLFVSRGDTENSAGKVWQVKGDAIFMRYQHANDVDLFGSGSYYTSYTLNNNLSKSQESLIEESVTKEEPPRAKDQHSVKENCQGWTIRVLRRIQADGVVKKETVDWIENDLKEPINR